jgi:hypothetical protein
MVRAILDGRKTQTRRVVKHKPDDDCPYHENGVAVRCPYGKVGDRLWVRETWRTTKEANNKTPTELNPGHRIWYDADESLQPGFGKRRPSIFMLRWASRIDLEIVGVRVERLQEITHEDAIAEGLAAITKDYGITHKFGIPDRDGYPGTDNTGWPWEQWQISPVDAFQNLWTKINGAGTWAANPWVWVVEFKRIT